MTAPEKIGTPTAQTLQTEMPGVTVRAIDLKSFPQLKALYEKNEAHFREGGTPADELTYAEIEKELREGKPTPHQRLAIWYQDKLVGFVNLDPRDDNSVEVSYGIDQGFARKGIASAAVKAVVEHENENGKDVIAEVNNSNVGSRMLLGKLGFDSMGYDSVEGRHIYKHESMSDEALLRKIYF